MIEGLFHYQVLNVVINALFAYLTTLLLIETFLKVLRVKRPRFKSLIRLIPLLKLPLDIWLADWSRWALLHGIIPLDCEGGSRFLLIGCSWMDALSNTVLFPIAFKIGFELVGGYSFSVADLLSPLVNSELVRAISYSFMALTFLRCIVLLITFVRNIRYKREFLNQCIPCYRSVENLLLIRAFKKTRIEICVHSRYKGSPILAGFSNPKIVFPKSLLDCLDQKEFEAIIAHELQHAKNKDNFIRAVISLINVLFWWIPTGRLINSIELQQELACDQKCTEYNIEAVELASGIVKVAKYSTPPVLCFGAHLFCRRLLKMRIHKLLDDDTDTNPIRDKLLIAFGLLVASTIFFGKFWIV